MEFLSLYSVANPGFPRPGGEGGGCGAAPTPEFGAKSIIWQDYCGKPLENERQWTKRGLSYRPFASANVIVFCIKKFERLGGHLCEIVTVPVHKTSYHY